MTKFEKCPHCGRLNTGPLCACRERARRELGLGGVR